MPMDSEQTFWTSRMSSSAAIFWKICRTSLREISSATVFVAWFVYFSSSRALFPRRYSLSATVTPSFEAGAIPRRLQIAGKPIERAAVAQNSQATAVSAVMPQSIRCVLRTYLQGGSRLTNKFPMMRTAHRGGHENSMCSIRTRSSLPWCS